MNPQIEWQQPQIVWDWKKQTMKAEIWQIWLFMTKIVGVLWAIVVPCAYYWGPSILPPALFASWFTTLILIGLFFPTFATWGPFLASSPDHFRKSGQKYQFTSKGAECKGRLAVSWKRIESYRFTDHPKIPGIRVLQIKVKSVKAGITVLQGAWCDFDFDPILTPEAQIESVIHHYLPSP